MELTFAAQIFAVIGFTDEELDFLIKCTECHYDSDVKALSKQGGCLFGAKGVNEWYKISKNPDKTDSDKARSYEFRQIDRMSKALDMRNYINDEHNVGQVLRNRLLGLLKTINEKTELVNNLEILK